MKYLRKYRKIFCSWKINLIISLCRKRHPATVQTPGRQFVEEEVMEPLVNYLDRLEPSWANTHRNNGENGRDFNDNFRCDADKGYETQFVMEFSHLRLGSQRWDKSHTTPPSRTWKLLIFQTARNLWGKCHDTRPEKLSFIVFQTEVVLRVPGSTSVLTSTSVLLRTKDKVAVGIIKKNLSKISSEFFCKISVTFCCLILFYSSPPVGTLSNISSKYCLNFVVNVRVPHFFLFFI